MYISLLILDLISVVAIYAITKYIRLTAIA